MFKNKGAEIFVPDNSNVEYALNRITHMGIAAHQDDIEIMAYQGILECFGKENEWFCGAVVTDGAGSPRDDIYSCFTDRQMQEVRRNEQKKAAYVGEYGALALLDYPSTSAKDPGNRTVVEDIKNLISVACPKVIYTHNLADKHDTHVGVALKVITTLRELPAGIRPDKLYGCEVWRNLDWVNDEEKAVFDISAHPNMAAALLEVFDSQICGGKRYDLATAGRRVANATYAASHSVDTAKALSYAMDLTPLIKDIDLDICGYIQGYIDRFGKEVLSRLKKLQK